MCDLAGTALQNPVTYINIHQQLTLDTLYSYLVMLDDAVLLLLCNKYSIAISLQQSHWLLTPLRKISAVISISVTKQLK